MRHVLVRLLYLILTFASGSVFQPRRARWPRGSSCQHPAAALGAATGCHSIETSLLAIGDAGCGKNTRNRANRVINDDDLRSIESRPDTVRAFAACGSSLAFLRFRITSVQKLRSSDSVIPDGISKLCPPHHSKRCASRAERWLDNAAGRM